MVSAALGMIPVALALYECFLAPATAQGGVIIPRHLWYLLCVFAPTFLPLLSAVGRHAWPGGLAFGLGLVLSNALIYAICGFLISFAMRNIARDNPIAGPQPGATH